MVFSMFKRLEGGFTLVEQSITAAVIAAVVGAAAPSIERARQQRQVEGTAQQLRAHIQFARGLAVARQDIVHLRLQSDVAGSCYIVHTGTSAECECSASGSPICSGSAEVLAAWQAPAGEAAQVVANVRTMAFEPGHGTVTPTSTIKVSARDGRTLHVVTNVMGRVRTCSVGGEHRGYPLC